MLLLSPISFNRVGSSLSLTQQTFKHLLKGFAYIFACVENYVKICVGGTRCWRTDTFLALAAGAIIICE